jgi:hypothetical protein
VLLEEFALNNLTIFSKVTICEMKNGFLLIVVFSKLFNTQNYGHQGSILGGLYYYEKLSGDHLSQYSV